MASSAAGIAFEFRGVLQGHSKWVTRVCTPSEETMSDGTYTIASSSRDGSAIVWNVDPMASDSNMGAAGFAVKSYKKHNGPINDIVFSADGKFLLTASDDKLIRLWDVPEATCFRQLTGHTAEVTGICMSANTRHIVSCGRDRTIRLWNTLGEEKFRFTEGAHTDAVSSIAFSREPERNIVVTAGEDGLVKVWSLDNFSLMYNIRGHIGPVNTVALSPDGSLAASGGSDGKIHLWDIVEGAGLYTLDASAPVYALCFSPVSYWISAATANGIKVFHLEKKIVISDIRIVSDKKPDCFEAEIQEFRRRKDTEPTTIGTVLLKQKPSKNLPWVTSLTWSKDGMFLFAGSSDSNVYAFGLKKGTTF